MSGRSACTTIDARAGRVPAAHERPAIGGGVERSAVGDDDEVARRAHSTTSGALGDDRRSGRGAGGVGGPVGERRARTPRARVRPSAPVPNARRAATCRAERSHRDHDAGLGERRRKPTAWAAYATGRGTPLLPGQGSVLSRPALGVEVDDRGRRPHPARGSGDPREQPHLVSRSARARVPRPIGAVAGCGSSPRPSCSTSARSARRCARCTRSRCSAAPRTRPRRSSPRSTRCGAGECVTVFPEGTISLDLEPMAGKSGTARLAQPSGVPVTPVGLWGTHRIMFKGRKPRGGGGRPDRQCRRAGRRRPRRRHQGGDRPDHGARSATCVARAREIYPQRPDAGRRRGGGATRDRGAAELQADVSGRRS